MSDKRIDIEYIIGGLEISGYGISEKGKVVSLPSDVATSLIEQGIATVSYTHLTLPTIYSV